LHAEIAEFRGLWRAQDAVGELQIPVLGQATVGLGNGKVTGRIDLVQVAGRKAPAIVANAVSQAKSIYDGLSFLI
jgi:hypothetical protein